MTARQESAEGKINLPEDEASIVKLLVQYLYQAEYNPKLPDSGCMDENHEIVFTGRRRNNNHYKFPHSCQGSRCSASQVCEHHCCGNYCDYDCVDFICQSCCPNTLPVVTFPPAKGDAKQLLLHAKMYEIADKYDVVDLKQLAREKFLRATAQYWNSELFAPAAHYAFSTTPEQDKGLRDVVSKTISTHMVLLNKPAVEALLTEFNGLAFGLLKMRAKELGWLKSD
jgi:hypothetical protein